MTESSRDEESPVRLPRSRGALVLLGALFGFAFLGFCALGIWQIERRAWKLDLIERVEARIHAPPVAAPAASDGFPADAKSDEYRHVRLSGHFLPGLDSRVQAVTRLGPGFWILSPFQTDSGDIVLVNRGFVPNDWQGDTLSDAPTQVDGLLRISEPKGAFLRHNDPAAQRWYSRDVRAIAQARGLDRVAPYFVDAAAGEPDAAPATGAPIWPRGGLTVTQFPNNHLSYALTWFALALMVAGAGGYLAMEESRLRKRAGLRPRFSDDAGQSASNKTKQ